MTIRCFYSCHTCGLEKVACEVPAREEGQDVVVWLEQIAAPALSRDHDRRSPACKPQKLDDLMIPIEGVDRVGGPTVS